MPRSPYDKNKTGVTPTKLKDTKKLRDSIRKYASLHLTQKQMCFLLGVSPTTFSAFIKKNVAYRLILEEGKALSSYNVRNTAYAMATSGKNGPMTMFWLKVKDQWNDKTVLELVDDDDKKATKASKAEEDAEIDKLLAIMDDLE